MIETKMSILKLIKEAEEQFAGTGKALLDIEDYVAEYLTANGAIVPPVKMGGTVYLPWMYGGQKGIALCSVVGIVNRGEKSYVETNLPSDDDGFLEEYNYGDFYFTDFGKNVFLTREEAEKGGKE